MLKTQVNERLKRLHSAPKKDYDALFLSFFEKSDLSEKIKDFYFKIPKKFRSRFYLIFSKQHLPMRSRIKLKCLDCFNFQKDEISNCPIVTCSLYDVRPYQKKN